MDSSTVISSICIMCSVIQVLSLETPSIGGPILVEGESQTILCEERVSGGNATLSWSRSDEGGVDQGGVYKTKEIPGTGIWLASKTLTFTPSRSMNTNPTIKFTCTASYNGQTTSTDWAVFVYVRPTGPTITSSASVVSGQQATLKCEATSANPVAGVSWRIDSDYYRGTSVETRNTDGTFNVVNTLNHTFNTSDIGKTLYCDMTHALPNSARTALQTIIVQYPPQVTVDVTSYTVTEAGTVTLQCSVKSTPTAYAVNWTKDGAAIDWNSGRFLNGRSADNPSLTITDVKAADRGKYVCSATNTIATGRSPEVTLIVNYLPKVTIQPGLVNTDEGQTFDLSCIFDSFPNVTQINWVKVNNNKPTTLTIGGRISGGSLTSPSNLTVSSVQAGDAGGYRCDVTNDIGKTESREVSVVVNYSPRNVTVSPSSLTVKEGSALSLQCTCDAFPAPAYAWTYPAGNSAAGALLSISSAAVDHNGTFVCTATNSIGSSNQTADVNVLYPPRINVSSSPISANTGDTVLNIACIIDSNPPATAVSWTKNQATVDLTTPAGKYSGGTTSSPSLVIHNVDVGDEGSYVCAARNSETTNWVQSSPVLVTISYAPRNLLILPSSDVTLREGSNYILSCKADGVPSPAFYWTQDGRFKSAGESLTFSPAAKDDIGTYVCNVTNMRGSAVVTVKVDVEYSPKFTLPAQAFGADRGDNLTIEYSIESNPPMTTFEWFKDSRKLDLSTPAGKYKEGTFNSTRLVILNLQPADAGSYVIQASNSIGTTQSQPITVDISYPPRNTQTNPANSTEVRERATIVIQCTTDAVPSASFAWYRGSEKLAGTANLTVNKAGAGDAGTVRCVATNVKGSQSVNFTITVNYTPIADKSYTIVTTSVGQTAILKCGAHAHPNITGYIWKYGNLTLSETGQTLSVTPTSSTPEYFGIYICQAVNDIGTSADILILLQEYKLTSTPGTGASTSPSGLSSALIALIVLIVAVILLVIIIIIVCCYKHGMCSKICRKKKAAKGRVAPSTATGRHLAAAGPPRLRNDQKTTNSNEYTTIDSRNPSSTAVSRKDVDINVKPSDANFMSKEQSRIIIEDDDERNVLVPNGTGPIISLENNAFQLPPLSHELADTSPEKKKKKKKKKKHRHRHERAMEEGARQEDDYLAPVSDTHYSTVA